MDKLWYYNLPFHTSKTSGYECVLQEVQSWLYVLGINDNPPMTWVGVTLKAAISSCPLICLSIAYVLT